MWIRESYVYPVCNLNSNFNKMVLALPRPCLNENRCTYNLFVPVRRLKARTTRQLVTKSENLMRFYLVSETDTNKTQMLFTTNSYEFEA